MYCKTNNNCTRYHKRERQSNTTTVQCTTKQITTVKHSKKVRQKTCTMYYTSKRQKTCTMYYTSKRQKTCTMYYTSKRQNNMMYLIHSDVIKFFRYVWFSSNTPFSFDSKTYGRDITQIIVDKESINTNNSKE
jgi:hypothetical protein